MRISINGLGPNDKIQYDKNWYINGAILEMDDRHAEAFINAKLVVEIKSADTEKEAEALKELEKRNEERRKEVRTKQAKRDESEVR